MNISSPAPRAKPGKDERSSPREATGVLALRLVTDDGAPLADVKLEVRDAEAQHCVTTDSSGLARLELSEGPHDVRLAEAPLVLPPASEPHSDTRRDVLVERGRIEPFVVSARPAGTEPRTIAVRRPVCTEVLVDGYAMGSVVLRWGGTRERLLPDGTVVVGSARAAMRTALWWARGRQALVVGHADPAGSDVSNAEVAMRRAESVHLYLAGDHDAWAEHAAAHGDEIDRACAAVACARIAGEPPPTLEDAVAVRRTLDVARALVDVPPGDDASGDFRAAAALYDVDLALFLRSDLAGLASLRGLVRWIGSGTGELGERYPRPPAELDPSATVGLPYALACRRSAVVVFADVDASALSETEELYDGTFRRATLEAPAEWRVRLAVLDAVGRPLPGGRAWVDTDVGVVPHTADPEGVVTFDAILGERVNVVLATDSSGAGTMIDAGTTR